MKIFTIDDFFNYAEVLRVDDTFLRPRQEWEMEDMMFEEEHMEETRKAKPGLQVWSLISDGEYDSLKEGVRTGDTVVGYFFTKVPAQALCFEGVRMAGGVSITWYSPKEPQGREAEETC